jgi:hypothetical protein
VPFIPPERAATWRQMHELCIDPSQPAQDLISVKFTPIPQDGDKSLHVQEV